MLNGELVASVISKPDIVASFDTREGRCSVRRIDNPLEGIAIHSVVEEDNWFLSFWLSNTSWDSMQSENIPVLGSDCVFFVGISVFLKDFLDTLVSVIVNSWV